MLSCVARHTRALTHRLQDALKSQSSRRIVGEQESAMQEEMKRVEKFKNMCDKQGMCGGALTELGVAEKQRTECDSWN